MCTGFSLPIETPTAVGSTATGITLSESMRASLDDQSIIRSKGARILYDEATSRLIIKLVGPAHEVAHRTLFDVIVTETALMGLRGELSSVGAARVTHNNISKEPDSSFQPVHLLQGRPITWPSVIIESGYADSTTILQEMEDLWIGNSDRQVKVAIIMSMEKSRDRIVVEKWVPSSIPQRVSDPALRRRGQSAVHKQEVVIVQTPDGQGAVSGSPPVIKF
ncbi:hypothetical protein BDW59DRAFT_158561 [Aspergillus cavernicola]|uniref:Uncharacterized protein n=1 Tax=Aspergillus cavernicola TaxID=176166 RepID=A0ABR4IR32_9EURO